MSGCYEISPRSTYQSGRGNGYKKPSSHWIVFTVSGRIFDYLGNVSSAFEDYILNSHLLSSGMKPKGNLYRPQGRTSTCCNESYRSWVEEASIFVPIVSRYPAAGR